MNAPLIENGQIFSDSSRRTFLKVSGITAVTTLAASCTLFTDPGTSGTGRGIDLGTGDIGILNYAYALESLEADFYIRVMQQPYAGMTRAEHEILSDIRDHEIVHREFYKRTLGAKAIPALQFDFSSVNFNDRTSVLTTAMTFEDTGVTAYNGAGHLVKDPAILVIAGKIVSVEARHAAVLRDLLNPRSQDFAPAPLDGSHSPDGVLKTVDKFIVTKLNGSRLPRV